MRTNKSLAAPAYDFTTPTSNYEVDRVRQWGNWEANHLFGADNQHDKLYGRKGNDLLMGQGDDDFISGGRGADTITGGNDNDVLKGGLGGDLFTFGSMDSGNYASGQDIILDFDLTAGDRIRVDGDVWSAAETRAAMVRHGDDAFIFLDADKGDYSTNRIMLEDYYG